MKWLVMLCVVSTLATSCAKIIDFKLHHPGQDQRYCNIKKLFLTIPSQYSGTVEIDFHYNAKGNPTLIEPIAPFLDDDLVHKFVYDKYDRLSYYAMIRCFPDTIIIFDHFYTYTSNPHLIIDEYRQLPPSDIPWHPGPIIDSLDDQGRVVRGPDGTFAYDARGNLVSSGNGWPVFAYPNYDSSINFLQTNKVLQFVFENYSVNNPIVAGRPSNPGITYNAFGLPSKYVNGYNSIGYLLYYAFDEMRIEYACDAPHKM